VARLLQLVVAMTRYDRLYEPLVIVILGLVVLVATRC